jgi:hypothetical protein
MNHLIPWPWSIVVILIAAASMLAHLKGWLEYHHMETGAILGILGWRLWSIGATTWGPIVALAGILIFADDALQEFVKKVIQKDHRSSLNVIFTWLWSDVLGWHWPFKF